MSGKRRETFLHTKEADTLTVTLMPSGKISVKDQALLLAKELEGWVAVSAVLFLQRTTTRRVVKK